MGRIGATALRASALGAGAVLVLSGCGISDGTDIAAVLTDEDFIDGEVNCGDASVDVTTEFTCFVDGLSVGQPSGSSVLEVTYLSDDEILVEGASIDPAGPGDSLYRRLEPGLVQLTEPPGPSAEADHPGEEGTLFTPGAGLVVERVGELTAASAQMLDQGDDEDRAVASFPAVGEELLLLELFAQEWEWPGGEGLDEPAILWLEVDGRRTQVLTLDDAVATVGGQGLLISVPEEAPAALVLEFEGHDQRVDARTGRRQLPEDDPAAGWYSLDPVHPHQSLIWNPEAIAGEQDVDGLEDRLVVDPWITEAGLHGWTPEHGWADPGEAWLSIEMGLGLYPEGTEWALRAFEAAAVELELLLTVDGEEHVMLLTEEVEDPGRDAWTSEVVVAIPPATDEILLRLEGEVEVFDLDRDETVGSVEVLTEDEVLLPPRAAENG
ncbi:hypothetical protein [Nesterenkonia sp. K-15-9-6]|uniref:hypothetical protein n=1 Tax=Nesterenkonia sp. K-15-9-6 TaxID=3093918 RepID=UPI00404502C5